ncbi:RbsD/FucU domain-containing protein [Robertmurraya sp. FSL W8-0741]|uniref:RbsD/FucU domain-containing protein n=1 Tax=Robertmurraya sp. FSL W8-0741 TaxID=2954629 RepID=UPI001BAFE01C
MMRPSRILHPKLSKALAECGHTDIILVTDAGFPIPKDANRIDLGYYAGQVDVLDILKMLRKEIFVDEVAFAGEVKTHHPQLYKSIQDIYTGSGAIFKGTTHEELVENIAPKAKVVIRSGSLNAWANFALVASTDPFAWFTEEDIKILPAYVERRRRIKENEVPNL